MRGLNYPPVTQSWPSARKPIQSEDWVGSRKPGDEDELTPADKRLLRRIGKALEDAARAGRVASLEEAKAFVREWRP